ncbi:hypothetical protein [Saccharibacillus alkalitolerans]|uniref:Uncharacterized protein n=1 Tax=Saccharibacillus alkalitolerans TaxID=2705290 RepID=A0ABX0F500_9BACL|nr:hypothetical protein [Saccharibacillus alkalitolerans]NGZ75782.1 hypothetical protein [Saccharibacillus alkalitolerans]
MDEQREKLSEETKERLERMYGLERPRTEAGSLDSVQGGSAESAADPAVNGVPQPGGRVDYFSCRMSDLPSEAPERFVIEPGQGIGPLRLGMPREEAETVLEAWKTRNLAYFFRVEYDDDGRIEEIETDRHTGLPMNAVLPSGLNVFGVPVERLLPRLKQFGPDASEEDEFLYEYPQAGISFWRQGLLSESDLEQEWFLEMAPDIQADEKRRLYFETVTVKFGQKAGAVR